MGIFSRNDHVSDGYNTGTGYNTGSGYGNTNTGYNNDSNLTSGVHNDTMGPHPTTSHNPLHTTTSRNSGLLSSGTHVSDRDNTGTYGGLHGTQSHHSGLGTTGSTIPGSTHTGTHMPGTTTTHNSSGLHGTGHHGTGIATTGSTYTGPTQSGIHNNNMSGTHNPSMGSNLTGTTHNGAHYNTTQKRGLFGGRSQKLGKGNRSSSRSGSRHREKKSKSPLFDINSGNFNRRPSFGQWLKFTLIDILTMIAMGAVGLGIYNADPAPSRSFPITFIDGEIVYPQFAYPLRTEIVPIWEAALLASLIPIAVILLMQIRIRSFWDVNNAIIGLLYSLITAAVFQVFIKWLIGGLRPHFLTVCQPDVSRVVAGGDGFRSVMFNRDVCTGDRNQINDSLESMPSGHSTAAFAGFIFLYLYLNAKLKVFSNHHPSMWKMLAVYAPVLGACLIAGSLTIDEYHNWYDCFAGAVIGTLMAFSAYRMVYASVWDFRFNHIPLTRHTPFSYGAGAAGAGGFEGAVFTRKAGWGYGEAYGGAPFDAAHNLRGATAGFDNSVHDNEHGHKSGGGLFGRKKHGTNDNNLHNNTLNEKNDYTSNRHSGVSSTRGVGTTTDHGYGQRNVDGTSIGHRHEHGYGHDDGLTDGRNRTTITGRGGDNYDNNRRGDYDSRGEYFPETHRHDVEHNAGGMPIGSHTGQYDGTNMGDSGRYSTHRKSLERKAVANRI